MIWTLAYLAAGVVTMALFLRWMNTWKDLTLADLFLGAAFTAVWPAVALVIGGLFVLDHSDTFNPVIIKQREKKNES